jgi:hypothetical protein
VTRAVTRYRTENRTYTYSGVEHYGRYASNLRVALGAEMDGLIAQVTQNTTESGFETDASFAQAGVYPQTANLTSPEGFVAVEERRLVADLHARLQALYAARYCRAGEPTIEEAARCAYLDHQSAPAVVRAALREQFGEDEALLSMVLSSSSTTQ